MFRRVLVLFLLLSYSVKAEEEPRQVAIARPAEGAVNDYFDDASKTSGGVLVGLRLAPRVDLSFDPENVEITLPLEQGNFVCVSGVSRDGLYWSRTPYRIDTVTPSAVVLKLQPFAQERYAGRLRSYPWSSVAIIAFESADPDCFLFDSRLLPEVPPNSDPATLAVYVNSNSQKLKASLDIAGATVRADCLQRTEARVAFDYACTLKLPHRDSADVATLVLEFDDGMTVDSEAFTVVLPASGNR
ncbi:hypothetical protein [Jhaorihella thermophila]|uniref:Uncharacterized protein n=1 Tax=Jhaorihella thermophila TaxID=488547 RepID=A0A1H5YKY5_9RHOB|nr:hypothetical protein [Jhaorihella thermophila]SEG24803.1 hypothetical protein SAMN05421751_12018 [Jhaorihella thermophila]